MISRKCRTVRATVWTFAVCLSVLVFVTLSFNSQPTVVFSDFSDYVNNRFPYEVNISSNTLSNDTGTTITFNATTTTPRPITDDFRKWFDMRTTVHPFVSLERHPFLPPIAISNNVCANSSVDILIYFNSACENMQRRRILRETWANVNVFRDISVRVVFVLGKSSKPEIRKHIRLETAVYGDIVQGDFVDTFRNLTYKSMLALKWINDNCAHARYIIKADDDIFVNIMKVVEDLLPKLSLKTHTVICHHKKEGSSPIIRNTRDKWYVPHSILSDRKTFPDFCSGYAVIMTTDVVPVLYQASYRAPFLPIDDAYMFGLLPLFSKKVKYQDAKRNFTLNSKYGLEQYRGRGRLTYIVTSASIDGTLEEYWTRALAKQSIWAQRHTHIVTMRKHMGPGSLV